MAHCSQEFALVGYSEDLERRPLKFVEPIPSARICSACGNIPRLTYTLLCGHTLCEPCYESCVTPSECVCPVDGDVCATKGVSSKEYPTENLLRREVPCWNEAHGCGVILPASQIAEHVSRRCQHHVSRCPKCLATVRSRDVCAHLKSRCTALVLHAAPESQPGTGNDVKAQLVAFEKKMELRVRELDAKLAQLSLESASQSDKLAELCHNNNHLKEALTEQYGQAAGQSLHRLDRNEAEMKALVACCEKTIDQRVRELDAKLTQLTLESSSQNDKLTEVCDSINHLKKALTEEFGPGSDRGVAKMEALYSEKSQALMTAITSVLTSVQSERKTHQRVITGYAALKEEALKEGWSLSVSDKGYFRQYLVTWGIEFRKDCESVYLGLCFQLHMGREDDFLEWPFLKEMKLSIIHPDTRQERHLYAKGDSSEATKKFYSRPIQDRNQPAYFGATRVESSDIERDGYVKRDQLLVRFEVL